MNHTEHSEICSELIAAARRCSESGMQSGNGGNFSARIPGTEEMYVKARDTAFAEVSERSVVRTDYDGNLLEGVLRPSKESLLHGVIYRACPDIHAIMHCHSPYATAWASTGMPLPFSTYHSRLKLKSTVSVFDTKSYVVPESYFPQILSLFEEKPETTAFLLRGHGLVAVGKTVREALFRAELIEETAQIAILERLLTAIPGNKQIDFL